MAARESAEAKRAVAMVARGKSVAEAARRVGVALSTVYRACERASVPFKQPSRRR